MLCYYDIFDTLYIVYLELSIESNCAHISYIVTSGGKNGYLWIRFQAWFVTALSKYAMLGVLVVAFISLLYAWLLRGSVLKKDKGTRKCRKSGMRFALARIAISSAN